MPTPDPRITASSIEANGLTFGLLEVGEGPLALCLHGFPDSAWTWQFLLPQLADAGYRAVAPFLRGYAPTDVPADGCYQPGAIAADINALHEALGGDSDAVIIGHDWGALATYNAVGSAPERWRAMVTAAVPPPLAVANAFFTFDQLHLSWYMFFFQHPLAETAVAMDDLAFIDRLWREWSPGLTDLTWSARCKDAIRDPQRLAAAIAYYRATIGTGPRTPEYDALEVHAMAPMPIRGLYLHGADDGCMGAKIIDETTIASFPVEGSAVEELPGVGHFLHLEDPEQVNRRILDFLAG